MPTHSLTPAATTGQIQIRNTKKTPMAAEKKSFFQFKINLPPVVVAAATLRAAFCTAPSLTLFLSTLLAAHVEMLKCGNLFIRFMLFLAWVARSEISSSSSNSHIHTCTHIHIYITRYIHKHIYACSCVHTWTYDNTKKYVYLCMRVHTGRRRHTFWNSKGISVGERKKECGRAEQRKGTTTWRIVALREFSKISTVRRRGGRGQGKGSAGVTKFWTAAKLKVHGHDAHTQHTI